MIGGAGASSHFSMIDAFIVWSRKTTATTSRVHSTAATSASAIAFESGRQFQNKPTTTSLFGMGLGSQSGLSFSVPKSQSRRSCLLFQPAMPSPNFKKSSHPYRYSPLLTRLQMIYAPPGSGYATPEDEPQFLPETYEPMMEYPGTMRPGRTAENQPYHDLPMGDDDPDPVPWPHFQEIEWHHRWEPPHEHPIPMEDFIELQGRWATIDQEAAVRAGARRGVRDRREMEEMDREGATLIMDDDDDEEEDIVVAGTDAAAAAASESMPELGEGVMGTERAIPSDATKQRPVSIDEGDEDEEEEDEGGFLLDLGLDADEGEGDGPTAQGASGVSIDEDEEVDIDEDDGGGDEPAFSTGRGDKGLLETMRSLIDEDDDVTESDDEDDEDIDLDLDLGLMDDEDEDDEGGPPLDIDLGLESPGDVVVSEDEDDEEDLDIDLDLMDDDEEDGLVRGGGVQMVPLDDLSDSENMDDEEGFDDGGFDYDGDDGGGVDDW